MTHSEKLQQIFEAALRDSSDFNKPPTRAFPASRKQESLAISLSVAEPEFETESIMGTPSAVDQPGLSDTASAEFKWDFL